MKTGKNNVFFKFVKNEFLQQNMENSNAFRVVECITLEPLNVYTKQFLSADNTHHYYKAHSNNNTEWNNKMCVNIERKIIVQYEKEFWVKWINK